MGSKIKVFFAHRHSDVLEEIIKEYTNRFDNQIDIIGCTDSGEKLLDLMRELEPDVIVSELLLKDMNVITSIKIMRNQAVKTPKTIILTDFISPNISAEAISARINYILLKPVTEEVVMDKIIKCIDTKNTKYEEIIERKLESREIKIKEFLLYLGFKNTTKGYDYLVYAVLICDKDKTLLEAVTKALYPSVAKNFNTTPSRVERAIRHAIESTWVQHSTAIISEFKGLKYSNAKPTNSQFISFCIKYDEERNVCTGEKYKYI